MEGPNGSAQASVPLPAAAHGASPTPAAPAAPAPTQKPVPTGALVVYATGDELAIRRKPVIARETLIKRVPVKSKLTVLEPPEKAKYKVGQGTTWLEVQTEDGTQGYVAAWFVSLEKPVIQAAPRQASLDPPPAQDPNTLVVYAAADGRLALRRLPVISSATLIRWVPQNTEFAVLEPADQARKKIGVPGQWLNVRDVRGTQGYVSAQYVSTSRFEPAVKALLANAQPKTLAPVAGDAGKLVIRCTTEGLALRRQPFVSSATLIKREPLNAELLVLEPVTGAEGLIGQYNRWINNP